MTDIIELAKEAGMTVFVTESLERFAALIRADIMKPVMDTCEAEYKKYDQLVVEEDAGHEEATAIIHLMRKLEKLK